MISPTLKADWCAALRSGKYEQGFGSICRNGTYCGLGVLGAVMGTIFGDLLIGGTPLRMSEEITLITLNDIQKYKFPEIADWIEENL